MHFEPRQQPLDRRARKRIAAMRHIQSVALDLFDDDGYDAVTISQIANAADIGERSIYRYFGTKPMLVLHDELDLVFIDVFADQVQRFTLIEAAHAAIDASDQLLEQGSTEALRRLALIHQYPDLLAAVARYTDQIGDALGATIAEARQLPADDLTSRIHGRSIAAACDVAIDHWFHDPHRHPLSRSLHDALDSLGTITDR